MPYLFTSESVSEGHPDKVADQISDSLVDHFLAFDPTSKVACETLVTTGQVILAGEVKSKTYLDVQQIARDVIKRIGYTKSEYMFEANSCGILSAIHEQSPDINQGVERAKKEDQGAGDQGMMFGYACKETDELMPAPIVFAHSIMIKASEVRKNGLMPCLRPDGKCQVTVEYKDGIPFRIHTVVLSHQHDPDISYEELKEELINKVIKKALPEKLLDSKTIYLINPTGRFVIGGPMADTGLTGRKIVVDTYGGAGKVGGGAFSGKDPSKVDRSAAYIARYICKNIVKADIADKCEIELAYAIGVAHPVSVTLNFFGTGKYPEEKVEEVIEKIFPLKPKDIINHLNLQKPIYLETATFGHFGRDKFSWEKTDKVEELLKYLKK